MTGINSIMSRLTLNDIFKDDLEEIARSLFELYISKATIDELPYTSKHVKWLSRHPNLTIDVIQSKNINWNYDLISLNESIDLNDLIKSDLPVNYSLLTYRSDLTSDIVESNIHKPWDFWHLTISKQTTAKILMSRSYVRKFAHLSSGKSLNFNSYRKRLIDSDFYDENDYEADIDEKGNTIYRAKKKSKN